MTVQAFRRTRVAALGVLSACAVTWLATAGSGASADPGQGNAYAQGVAVLPKEGSLAVGVTFGEAIAGHTNLESKAQSQDIDLGAIGTSLTSSNCGQAATFQPNQVPQPLIVESGTPGADKGQTQSDYGGSFTKFGQAAATPYAKATTKIAPFGIAGAVEVGGGTVSSWSGLVSGNRIAGATSDISGMTFPGGISLSNLHWEVAFPSGGAAKPTGSFSIGHATIGTTTVPTQNSAAALQQLNAALNPLGFQLNAPSAHLTQGTEYVDPLVLSVVPNSTRDGVLGTVLGGIQPVRQQLTAAVLNAYCQADTELTVADIGIGSISGAGSFNMLLGGVQAVSGELAQNGFNLGIPGLSAGGVELGSGGAESSSGSGLSSALSSSGGSAGSSGALPSAPGGTSAGSAPAAAPVATTNTGTLRPIGLIKGKRGGALAAVGLAGLLLLAALAEGDRRMMRKAQRAVPEFEE